MAALAGTGLTGKDGGGERILKFETMFGVAAPFLGAPGNIRGVNGAGAAWKLNSVEGDLRDGGRLEISVRGLVLVRTNANPIANFRAIVSCLTSDTSGTVVATSNVVTETFPASPAGDADLETVVNLPTPCVAPIVFVTNTNGTAWFSVTGR